MKTSEPSFDYIKTSIFNFPVCKIYLGTWGRRARRARKARRERHLVDSPKLALGQVVQIQLMGLAGLWNQPSYEASGNLLIELVIVPIMALGQLNK